MSLQQHLYASRGPTPFVNRGLSGINIAYEVTQGYTPNANPYISAPFVVAPNPSAAGPYLLKIYNFKSKLAGSAIIPLAISATDTLGHAYSNIAPGFGVDTNNNIAFALQALCTLIPIADEQAGYSITFSMPNYNGAIMNLDAYHAWSIQSTAVFDHPSATITANVSEPQTYSASATTTDDVDMVFSFGFQSDGSVPTGFANGTNIFNSFGLTAYDAETGNTYSNNATSQLPGVYPCSAVIQLLPVTRY